MFNGVFTAVVTPFTKTGHLDLDSFRSLLEWQADQGIHGFVPCGTTGENPTLSRDEWRSLIRATVQIGEKRGLLVIAGCGSNNTAEVCELVFEAHELGANGALIVTPYYNKPGQRGLIQHYATIAEKSKLPIVLYNVPGRTNVPISVETMRVLFQSDKIVGIKEASGNYSQWLQIANEVDLSKKCLLAGDDDALAPILALGGAGIISASANVAPKRFVALYNDAVSGNLAGAFGHQAKLYPLVQSLFIETSPAPSKFALSLLGRIQNVLRLPLVTVSNESEAVIKKALLDLGLL